MSAVILNPLIGLDYAHPDKHPCTAIGSIGYWLPFIELDLALEIAIVDFLQITSDERGQV